jgi:exosome complex RNA-binding protein Csl4
MNTDEDILQLFENSQDKFYLQIKELIGVEEDQPEEIINKIKQLLEISQIKNNEYEKLRNFLNIEDENLIESVTKLSENFHRLEEEHEKLVQSNQFNH